MSKIFLVVMLLVLSVPAMADGGQYNDTSSDKPTVRTVKKLLKKEQYQQAIDKLLAMEKKDSNNADVYNLLGYSHRKLQRYDEAYDYYQQALTLEPEHKGANEYLGELYLETDRLEQAQKQLQILEGICSKSCREYKKLAKAIESK
ncbi:MAG: tetratricopeptide repeat protein [Arenicella sp.]